MVCYQQQLQAEFNRMHPELQISEQRIADQYRVIMRNNLILESRLNNIKQEVEREISQANSETVLGDNNQRNQEDNAELRDNLIRELRRAL
ncbi:hypothetical protein HHI36_017237 [Cryptolaemus montrouzieri]|uniref:Uncharacterized protein n=1 Tax=Cryptolaemus montrouzieri TaxID=559131 RepID=A0ABD2NMB4_9CUCU